MEKKIVGREFFSSTKCLLDDEDFWKATNLITDRVLYEGETEWVEETVDAMSIDKNCQSAIQTAMSSTLTYLAQNVYQNGFNGLVEFREYERSKPNVQSIVS
jgi:hypothetical protein